ncbi:MAG: pyruvate dehydrogenase, partial [Rhodobacteraceae bacterium]|nr:pyruvate dehydrogenase [Paracoccaceae bacterium]
AAPARPPRPPQASPGGRILASPKARRLAREAGLDLGRLAAAGHPQPYHVRDLEVLRTLPAAAPAAATALQARRLTAEVPAEGFTAFAAWAAENAGLDDPAALLAGLAAAGLGRATALVEVDGPGPVRRYHVPGGPLSAVTAAAPDDAAAPDLVVRDLRGGWIAAIHLGPEPCPVLSLADTAGTLALTLECAADALSARQALALVSAFAGRLSQPLRHLL